MNEVGVWIMNKQVNKQIAFFVMRTILIILCSFLLFGCATVLENVKSFGDTPKKEKLGGTALATAPVVSRPDVAVDVRNIVLLLPLSGDLAHVGTAVRNGFLAAYYHDQKQKAAKVNVKVIDTNGRDINDVYREAVTGSVVGSSTASSSTVSDNIASSGATGDAVGSGAGAIQPNQVDVIVGPLIKEEIAALAVAGKPLPVPTLALNTLNDYRSRSVVNLYQFGLLPQDEVQQAATKMLQDGYRKVAVITPNNSWGHNIAAILREEMTRQGGQVVAVLEYESGQDDFDLKVRQFLQVDSEALRQTKTPADYHGDAQAVFLVADVNIARQIVPLLRFYTNGKLPLYATSHIYSGFVRAELDQDLDGVTFCDIPWTVTNPVELSATQQEIRNKINSLWSDSLKNNVRLYALGVDAYNVAVSLNALLAAPQTGFPGATGILTLDNYNHVYRQLRWTVMRHGIPRGL